MDQTVVQAIRAALHQFGTTENIKSETIYPALESAFRSEKPFMDKVADMDRAFDDEPRYEALREVFFDLLMVNFFTEDVRKLEEDYLESEEWEKIEEETLDRGTELLNVLLYLRECEDEDIEPGLEDYLKEFLLVEEDEFQDEHHIYEIVIANQALVDASYPEISAVADKLPEDAELKELFYPFMSFFYEQKPNEKQFEEFIKASKDSSFDSAIYSLLVNFNNQ